MHRANPELFNKRRIDINFGPDPLVPELHWLGRVHYLKAFPPLVDHTHPELEICYLARGRQTYMVKDQSYALTGGDVYVTFPGETHSTGATPEEKSILYWLLVDIGERRPSAVTSRLTVPLFQKLRELPVRRFRGCPAMGRLLDDIILHYHAPDDPLRWNYIQIRLMEFLMNVVQCAQRCSEEGQYSEPIRRSLSFIEEQLETPTAVGQVAGHSGLSESRFKVRFGQEVGMPPGEYILRKRIEKAAAMLADGKRSVTDVAYQMGFNSSQYFATAFKRITGSCPRQHRGQGH